MADQKACNLTNITTMSSDNYLMAITDLVPANNVVEKISKDDFIADIISIDAGNLIELGTDNKLKVIDTDITLQGNNFNGNSQLIQTTSAGKYPALDGSLITGITASNPTASTANMPTITNNVTDANNDIDFSAGFCFDLTTTERIESAAMTKRLDAGWSAGTNQGMLDTGSKAISSWYHLFVISKADGTSDFLASLSAISPTMPSGYVNKRRIASIRTNASGNILGFRQFGNTFKWNNTITEFSSASWSTTPTDLVLTTPLGVISQALLNYHVGAGGVSFHYIKEKLSGQIILLNKVEVSGSQSTGLVNIFTDTASAIQPYATGSSFFTSTIYSLGYIDSRGVN